MMDDDQDKPLTLKEMLQSVLSAALGVQSGKNRSRDFSRGKPSHFIILGVLFTMVFVLGGCLTYCSKGLMEKP